MGEQVGNAIGIDPTLNGAISTTPASGTSETWTLSATGSGSTLPQRAPYVARVDDSSSTPDSPFEIVHVTAILSSTTLTVKRGMGGTVSKAHANGATFRHVLTAGGLNRLVSGTQHRRRSGAIAETVPRLGVAFTNQASALVSGRRHLTAIELPANEIITAITYHSATSGAVTPTHQWFELLDEARAILALTTDDTTTAWAANSEKTLNLSTPFQTTYAGLYYLGIVVTAGTLPTLFGVTGHGTILGLVPILNGTSDTGLTAPPTLPASAAAIAATAMTPFAYSSY